ncbi:TetR/AcrR family transcriptional regulator [Alkalibacillus almallahensis]|uniref:TetR/AcrR family transcriptional regulator n=1 Tax=Alkalibacillus almallahensis TaxID=1379154 RepID=UPI001420AE7C|nr:TetR/AcrR family transcriptional regulator [Alkalibacillus almallahensis]NIK12973.1 AcrR family transcriptional regulator [Alkalibacillus almallahensis]
MGNRREEMLDAAVQLFQENGFYDTSVEDITSACGISKGGFYKHFDSKESMVLELLQRYYDELFWEAENLTEDLQGSSLLTLKKKIAIELEKSIDYHYFFYAVLTDFHPNDQGPIPTALTDIKRKLRDWHKQALLEAFGPTIKTYLNDLTVVMEGTIHSYLIKIIWQTHLPLDMLAEFITESLHAIVTNDDRIFPVLPSGYDEGVNRHSILEDLKQQLETIHAELQTSDQASHTINKDLETIDLLIEELGQQSKREFLIDALLTQLSQRPYLKQRLTSILTTWEVWKGDST